jgi:hypothetical protein
VEYESVLLRRDTLDKAQATALDMIELLDGIAGICIPVVFDYQWRPSGAHADDELVIETAVNGQADFIATFNLKDMQASGHRFGIVVDRPGVILRKIKQ